MRRWGACIQYSITFIQVVLLYSRSYCKGSPIVQMFLLYRWSIIQVVLPYRQSYCTSSLIVQVVLLYKWSYCTGGVINLDLQ